MNKTLMTAVMDKTLRDVIDELGIFSEKLNPTQRKAFKQAYEDARRTMGIAEAFLTAKAAIKAD